MSIAERYLPQKRVRQREASISGALLVQSHDQRKKGGKDQLERICPLYLLKRYSILQPFELMANAMNTMSM